MLKPVAAALAVSMACTEATAVDLHQFWDGRCRECHGHAGPFARRHLIMNEGVLVGGRSQPLESFLVHHEAGAAQAGSLSQMLLAQLMTKPVYQEKCSRCHDTAAEFARGSLLVRDGSIIGRTNGQPIAEFLKRHGKLAPDEVTIVVESLKRVLSEIGASPTK